eukprot:3822619-Pyramimonas_sp.AAC.1
MKLLWAGTQKRQAASRIARAGIETSSFNCTPVAGGKRGELGAARSLAVSVIEPRTSGKGRALSP